MLLVDRLPFSFHSRQAQSLPDSHCFTPRFGIKAVFVYGVKETSPSTKYIVTPGLPKGPSYQKIQYEGAWSNCS